jgi:tetratricopeptide (TPR) repeat protein
MAFAYQAEGKRDLERMDHKTSLKNYFKSYTIIKHLNTSTENETYDLAKCCQNMGNVYFRMDSIKRALTFYNQAFKIRNQLAHGQHNSELADSLQTISIVYNRLGDLRTALKYSLKALKMRQSLLYVNDNYSSNSNCRGSMEVAVSHKNVARIYFKLNDFVNGMKYFVKGFNMKRRLESGLLIS